MTNDEQHRFREIHRVIIVIGDRLWRDRAPVFLAVALFVARTVRAFVVNVANVGALVAVMGAGPISVEMGPQIVARRPHHARAQVRMRETQALAGQQRRNQE